jgi:festuclavine dehydrogenase
MDLFVFSDGKVPFISAGDIAAVAFHVLTDEKLLETDYRILSPELSTS